MPETAPVTSTVRPELPALPAQAERLIELGVHELAGLTATELRAFARDAGGDGLPYGVDHRGVLERVGAGAVLRQGQERLAA
ncbi:hypothetical protein ABZ702_35180, partial [Streptomyces cyaneofuscatus]